MGTALRLRPPEGSNLGIPPKNALKQYNFFNEKFENTKRDANLECITNPTTYWSPGPLAPPLGSSSNPNFGR